MYNKKGLSTIVATVLIVLLVIAGITLVWTPIRKLITEQSEDLEANCLMASPQIEKACMNGATLEVTVSNGAEITLDGIQVIYGNSEDSLNKTAIDNTIIETNSIQKVLVTDASGTTAAKIAAIIEGETCEAGSITSGIIAC